MATFVPTANAATVYIDSTLYSDVVTNTLSFWDSAGYSAARLEDLAGYVRDWWEGAVLPELGTGFETQQYRAYAQDSTTAPLFVLSDGGVGGRIVTELPGQNVMTVTFQTATRGRSGRGRNYISGLGTADVSANDWTGSAQAAIQAAYEDIPTYIPGIFVGVHVVLSKFLNGAPRSSGIARPVISYRANETVYTMKNRSRP